MHLRFIISLTSSTFLFIAASPQPRPMMKATEISANLFTTLLPGEKSNENSKLFKM